MKNIILGCVTGLVLLLTVNASQAQGTSRCAPRDLIIDRLTEQYSETQRSIGLAANSTIVEQYGSDNTGTWSIVVTNPNGMSCLVAAGNAFEQIIPEDKPEGDDM